MEKTGFSIRDVTGELLNGIRERSFQADSSQDRLPASIQPTLSPILEGWSRLAIEGVERP